MEESVPIRSILQGEGEARKVLVRGWLQNKRSSGGIIFALLRDGTGVIQCTLRKENVPTELFSRMLTVRVESTVELTGSAAVDKRAPGGWEIKVDSGRVLSEAMEDFPIAKKFHGPDFLLDNRHLFVRSDKLRSMLKVRSMLLATARAWFSSHAFTEVQVPTLTSAAVEGGATLFEVKYFDEKAYLTQSWQLYAEALISSIGSIYTIAPSYRAEKSRTRRHLTEYTHLEAEAPWCDLEGIMKVEEQLLTRIIESIHASCRSELEVLGRNPEELEKFKGPFPRVTYTEALKMLGDNPGITWGDDLGYEQEKVLTARFDKPFFVTHYPRKAKAFYHKPDPKNPDVTLSADLLAPEEWGEITGGGQRIEEYEELLARIKEQGLDPKNYSWYMDLRKFGTVPHSGFGLGVERVIAWLCKLDHVRDAIAFPRLINRVYP